MADIGGAWPCPSVRDGDCLLLVAAQPGRHRTGTDSLHDAALKLHVVGPL